jgi:hypothetical protein
MSKRQATLLTEYVNITVNDGLISRTANIDNNYYKIKVPRP